MINLRDVFGSLTIGVDVAHVSDIQVGTIWEWKPGATMVVLEINDDPDEVVVLMSGKNVVGMSVVDVLSYPRLPGSASSDEMSHGLSLLSRARELR